MGVQYNRSELKRIRYFKKEPTIIRWLENVGEQIAVGARALAPRETGQGAASIDWELTREPDGEMGVRVSWDRDHYYMWFHEAGTRGRQRNGRGVSPRPFLRPAAAKFLPR